MSKRREYERLSSETAGIVHEVARAEIVRTVGHDVVIRKNGQSVFGRQAERHRFHANMRVEALAERSRSPGFERADIRSLERDLALEIIDRDPVVVDDSDFADARRSEVHEERVPAPPRRR